MNDKINPQKNESTKDEKTTPLREVDLLTRDVIYWWNKKFVLIKKTRIKTWKGVFILAFIAGITIATIMIVSFNIQTFSTAIEGASLTLFTDDTNVTLEDGSNLVNADILLNSNSNDVVAVKAVVNYDPAYFELQSWDMSNSVFSNTDCVYNGGQCEIVNNDPGSGKITITVARPTPGVSTDSGIVAQLVFKALQTTIPASPNLTLSFTSEGYYNDSDVIRDDGEGTDILSSVQNATVNVYAAVCNSFLYSDWNKCQPDRTQTRTVVSSLPGGCYAANPDLQPDLEQDCEYIGPAECTDVTYSEWGDCQPDSTHSRTVIATVPADCATDNLVLTESCTYTPPVCTDITYSDWGDCQLNGKQSRTVVSTTTNNCVAENLVLEQDCDYTAPDCLGFTYSNWGDCQPDGTQARIVNSGSPAGCKGGNPETSQSCDYKEGSTICKDFTYSDWGNCQINGTQSRTVVSNLPEGCSGGNPDTERKCTFVASTCSEFIYNNWGSCQPNGTQSRTVASSFPVGCEGGNLTSTQSCQYANKSNSDDKDNKKDKTKPKFADMPLFLNKNRGDMVWWKATDNKKVVYYTYNFNGKKIKTNKKHFFIANNTPRGIYILHIKAYDKAGNSKSKFVTVRVK